MTWNALATASMNTTDRGDGNDAHPVIVTATDTFSAVASKTIYITVTPNAAPKFRETSVSGNIITSYVANVSESNSAGEITKIYFSDAESDTITITSQSHASGDFNIVKYSTYVAVNQVTSSLNFGSSLICIFKPVSSLGTLCRFKNTMELYFTKYL